VLKLFPDPDDTIEGTGAALRAGRTTCAAVLQKCLDRIEKWEPGVKAWVVIDTDGAIEQARKLDEVLAAGKCRGPLHGIPFGIKDIIDVAGLPTAAGFGPWRGRVAERDAAIVSALRHAGAVIVGKTVTTQFAWIDPPVTRNPWNLDRTPGGSSSGSAAAVATGMCLGAIGTQTGGSIIRPASFCGVAGFKPAHGYLPTEGILPFAPSLDHPGPIARTIGDLALVQVEVVEQLNEARRDIPHEWSREHVDREDPIRSIRKPPDRPVRLIRLRGFFDRRTDPATLEAFERALDILCKAGAEVIEKSDDVFDFEHIIAEHRLIMSAECAAIHEAWFAEHRDEYAPHIRSLVEEGLARPLTRYIRARLEQDNANSRLRQVFEGDGVDDNGSVIATPATIGPAPDTQTTGNPCFNSPWSYLGWPTFSIPIGLDPEGMPLAIQLVGHDWSRHYLYWAAYWCEAVIRRASLNGSE
jgi:Asp-tRNA(Asn)/Glu-tRNA(Gln) amidotransferase A subunit family amidase